MRGLWPRIQLTRFTYLRSRGLQAATYPYTYSVSLSGVRDFATESDHGFVAVGSQHSNYEGPRVAGADTETCTLRQQRKSVKEYLNFLTA